MVLNFAGNFYSIRRTPLVSAGDFSKYPGREVHVALKLVRKKKAKPAATGGRRKKSEIAKFRDAIEVQMRLAEGEQVKKGRGLAKSWVEDGEAYGVEMVLVPRVGNLRLYPKSAIVIDTKQKKPPTRELKDLLGQVDDGKLTNRIYAALRQKKSASAKGK